MIFERFESLDEGYSGRSDQWKENFSHHPNLLFGTGLGSVAHRAIGYVKYPIFDGAIFKYISEFGIIGFMFFLLIIIRTTMYKIKFISVLWREYMIVMVCILQSTASNTLAMQVVLPLFWFCLGIIAKYNDKYGNNCFLSSSIPSHSR